MKRIACVILVLAAVAVAGFLALTAGAWYARRRWLGHAISRLPGAIM